MIKLTHLLTEQETFTATNKKTGNTSTFDSEEARDAAVKAGTHAKVKGTGDSKKGGKGGVNIFNKDKEQSKSKKSEPKKTKSSSSEPDYDKYTSKAQTVTDFMKGDLSTDDIQKIADKNFGKEVATEKELDDFLNNKFIQGMMADEYGVDKEQMVSKVKELKAALFGDKKEEPKKDGPVKDSSGGRAGNPKVNKATKKKAEELGITPENLGREEYELKMVQAAHEALTDSNFHSEARKLIAIMEDNPELAKNPSLDPNKPGLGEPGYEDWVKTTAWGSKYGDSSDETDELGRAASNEAGWDGKDALDGIAFELKMRGFKDLASKIQSVFGDEKNEGITKTGFKNHRLKDLLNEAMGPSKSTISKISDLLKKELNTSDVKVKKIPQGRVRTGYEIIPFGYAGGLYIDEDFGGVWQIYITNQQGFPVKNQWDIKQFEDDVEDEATALKAAVAVVKRFAKKHIMKKMK